MTRTVRSLHSRSASGKRAFSARARSDFGAHYPESVHKLEHDLAGNPLLDLDGLAILAEALPSQSVEYYRGDLPIGAGRKAEGNGLSIGQTIRQIETASSWAVLKNVEQMRPYAALLEELFDELRPIIEARTGKMMKTQGFIFISSPNVVTPYHCDSEHNILLQLRGRKAMTVYPAGNSRFAPDELLETYHSGGPRELRWDESFADEGHTFSLCRGDAIYVPVMAPHYVKNGDRVSISLSITWRSEWSFAEAEARAFNKLLRDRGLNPNPPGRWPSYNREKSMLMRIARRIPGLV